MLIWICRLTFYKVYKRKSAEGFQSLPYLVALFGATMWLYYAVLKKGDFLFFTINSFGGFMELIYIIIFIIYANAIDRSQTQFEFEV
ncbi:hypothetical protein Lal_00036704 [Lupinus albus]|nr:hypothetical protein Lal_00036704 [Lupinus albus]